MRFKFVTPELHVNGLGSGLFCKSLFTKLVMNGNVKEMIQSNTLDDRKITSTNPFLACFSNKFVTTKSIGKKLRALCKTQNATTFVQNILIDEHSLE